MQFKITGFKDTSLTFRVTDTIVDLGTIPLQTLEMEGVDITFKQPAYVRTIDGIKFTVQGTELETLNTLFDVLKASPRISSPDEETLEIIGKGSPLILVDRQPIISIDELKAIPADQVERIEIMTNPPAKYRAQGRGGGVIEVYTKDFHLQGYQMTISANGGANTQGNPQARLGVGLNIKKNKFSLSANLSERLRTGYSYSYSDAETTDETNRAYTSYSDNNNTSSFYYGSIKSAYRFNEDHKLTAGIRGYGSWYKMDIESATNYFESGNATTRQVQTTDSRSTWLNNSAFTNYVWVTDTNNSSLEVNVNYRLKMSDSDREFESQFDNLRDNVSTEFARQNEERDRPNIAETRATYAHISDDKSLKWSVGGLFSFLRNGKAFDQNEPRGGEWRPIDSLSNAYDYDEIIGGMFAEVSKMWDMFGFRAGIRGEFTYLNGYSNSLNRQFIDSSYVLPFPSASLIFKPSKTLNFTLSYQSGLSRPSFSNFDPFVRVMDSLRIDYGNPYLRPERSHAVNLEVDLFYSYSFSFGYKREIDPVSEISFVDDSTFLVNTTPRNAEGMDRYSASFNAPLKFKWLRGWNSLWVNYSKYTFGPAFGRAPFGALSFGGYSSLRFILPKDFALINRIHVMRWASDTYRRNAQFNWSLRLSKQLLDNNMRIYVAASNIIPPKNKRDAFSGNYFVYTEGQSRFTTFKVGVFYKFGRLKQAVQIRESKSGQSDRL